MEDSLQDKGVALVVPLRLGELEHLTEQEESLWYALTQREEAWPSEGPYFMVELGTVLVGGGQCETVGCPPIPLGTGVTPGS